jgi:hypothetical protein
MQLLAAAAADAGTIDVLLCGVKDELTAACSRITD